MDSERARAPACVKVKVVGPRQAIALDEVDMQHKQASAMRDYNPTLNAMATTQNEMRSILHNATQNSPAPEALAKKRKKAVAQGTPRRTATANIALYNACLERLHALKSQFDTSYEPLLQLLLQNARANTKRVDVAVGAAAADADAAVAAEPAAVGGEDEAALAAQADDEEEDDPFVEARSDEEEAEKAVAVPRQSQPLTPPSTHASSSGLATSSTQQTPKAADPTLKKLLLSVPKTHHAKCKQLYEYISERPDLIRMAPNGRLVVNGSMVHGSSYIDAIRALYQRLLGGVESSTIGVPQLLDVMNTIGVPSSLIASSEVRGQYMLRKKASSESVVPQDSAGSSRTQTGHGYFAEERAAFPGRPVKCLRLY
jgi:hypothetical protein